MRISKEKHPSVSLLLVVVGCRSIRRVQDGGRRFTRNIARRFREGKRQIIRTAVASLTCKSAMKSSSLPIFICLALLGLAGCSTASDHIGSGDVQLKVGRKYALQRDAILLANRGYVDSIENPDRNIQDYKPYRDYHPYYTKPRGVLPGGTVIEVEKIRFFKRNQFLVMGEIKTGAYKKQAVTPYTAIKGFTVGGWPPTGKVVMNRLCGGRAFDPQELARNLSGRVD